ncbi:hypothetical protein BD310DRAFT_939387 [Dichomitus squalens]|uniref:Uncharacterized protein n=1 Tax=Dichomitus squalens TaxID=114155 RepID=A0A4Q9PD85_9APHY|nr:hypothetical protein BD310DRAFT_939387 [Dichomitus squalens]
MHRWSHVCGWCLQSPTADSAALRDCECAQDPNRTARSRRKKSKRNEIIVRASDVSVGRRHERPRCGRTIICRISAEGRRGLLLPSLMTPPLSGEVPTVYSRRFWPLAVGRSATNA